MEFKEGKEDQLHRRLAVDIGTEWNLKSVKNLFESSATEVDIGTEWNLKVVHFLIPYKLIIS